MGSIPGSGRSPGGGHGNSLQYSCLENSMGRRAWWATVHSVTKNRTQLNDLAYTHATLLTSDTCRQMDILLPLRHTTTQTKPLSLFAHQFTSCDTQVSSLQVGNQDFHARLMTEQEGILWGQKGSLLPRGVALFHSHNSTAQVAIGLENNCKYLYE